MQMQKIGTTTTKAEFLTAKELALRWKVSERMIRDLEKEGRLKPIRLGRSVRYSLKEILMVEARGGF
jgi:hypothetical protein